jgi:predicted nuclease with TOPRIM domain
VERQGTEIEEYRDELVTQQAEHKRLNDELRVLRSENAMLSDELQLYRTLKQQDGGLEEVVQALVAKIQTEKE